MNTPVADNTTEILHAIISGLQDGSVVPCLGPGTLDGVVDVHNQSPIPADSNSLILAMTGGQPMAPRLMYEFPRAAMYVENKKGRSTLERFLNTTYNEREWSVSKVHHWLAGLNLPYVIDCNRDTQLQTLYADRVHTVVVGTARIASARHRYMIYQGQTGNYRAIAAEQIDTSLPILFKPLGTPLPTPSYIASDADFVDYISELMGGFAIPEKLKTMRRGKRYLMLGMRFTRDTERMIISDLMYGAAAQAGWALISNPGAKELRFCDRHHLQCVDADALALLLRP